MAVLLFSSPAFHIKLRDQWLHWSPRQVKERRHLIAQNARFLVLAAAGQWPNLASRVLKLVCARLPADWEEPFGYPVRETTTARNLSLFRTLAIFLFKRQSRNKGGQKSLPDFQSHVHRQPWGLIGRLTQSRHEE